MVVVRGDGMPYRRITGFVGKVYYREEVLHIERKHECLDCYFCQWCNNDKCTMCREQHSCNSNHGNNDNQLDIKDVKPRTRV